MPIDKDGNYYIPEEEKRAIVAAGRRKPFGAFRALCIKFGIIKPEDAKLRPTRIYVGSAEDADNKENKKDGE